MTTIASDRREGLDRRITLSGRAFPQRATYLGQMLGLRLDPTKLDEPLSPEQLFKTRPSLGDPACIPVDRTLVFADSRLESIADRTTPVDFCRLPEANDSVDCILRRANDNPARKGATPEERLDRGRRHHRGVQFHSQCASR